MAPLGQYSWPGNWSGTAKLYGTHSRLYKEGIIGTEHIRMLWADEDISPSGLHPAAPDKEADSALLQRTLQESNYKLSLTAQRLGISRSTLWRRLKHGLQR